MNACSYAWMAFVIVWLLAAAATKPTSRRENFWASLGYRSLSVIAAFLLFNWRLAVGFLAARFRPPSTIVELIGFAITVLGVGFAIWARFFIGSNWSGTVTVKENHELIRSGPYAIVRHPIYSGITLAALGTAIALGEVRGLIAVVLLLIAWRWKWGKEELFMTQQFGEQYTEYKRHVYALIPGIW